MCNGDGGPRPADRARCKVSAATHRVDVVRRLLAQGVSPATLVRLLPEFAPLIDTLVDETSDHATKASASR